MNRTELREMLTADGIRPDAYSLDGGLYEDRLCIEENYGTWEVYYVERGKRWNQRRFDTEDDACRYLLKLLREDHSAR